MGLLNSHGSYRLWAEFDAILGLDFVLRTCRPEAPLPAETQALVDSRNAARSAKDWAQSDALRQQMIALGYEVGDGPQGTTVKKRAL